METRPLLYTGKDPRIFAHGIDAEPGQEVQVPEHLVGRFLATGYFQEVPSEYLEDQELPDTAEPTVEEEEV